jgi:hypothetical protein
VHRSLKFLDTSSTSATVDDSLKNEINESATITAPKRKRSTDNTTVKMTAKVKKNKT